MEIFYAPSKIVSGPGAVSYLQKLGAERVFVVSDPFFYENGTAAAVAAKMQAKAVEIFHKVVPDPSVDLAAEVTAAVKQFQPDWIVALGGGSAMDTAKAVVYFSGMDVKLAAIPTTSGSGSEVTDFSILTHNGVKHPLVDKKLRPDLAILDEELLMKLPKSLVADGGFDVLSHAVEAYVATDAGAFTDTLAAEAFCTAFAHLPASYAGRTAVRGKVHLAATMAGMAFTQAGLGLCHGLSHSLGGAFHIPHGRLNAILLPAVIESNALVAGDKYAKLARSAGLGGSAQSIGVRNLKNALVRLRKELGLPATLAQAGVDPREVWHRAGQIVDATLADPCCATNPMKVEDFMVRRILEAVTGHV